MGLVCLDQVLHLAPRAIEPLVERPGFAVEIGDDEAGVAAFGGDFEAGGDPALPTPAACPVAQVGVAPELAWVASARSRLHRRRGPLGDHRGERLVGDEAEDVADVVVLAPVQDLGPALVAIATQHDADPWPVAADAPDDVPEDEACFHPRG